MLVIVGALGVAWATVKVSHTPADESLIPSPLYVASKEYVPAPRAPVGSEFGTVPSTFKLTVCVVVAGSSHIPFENNEYVSVPPAGEETSGVTTEVSKALAPVTSGLVSQAVLLVASKTAEVTVDAAAAAGRAKTPDERATAAATAATVAMSRPFISIVPLYRESSAPAPHEADDGKMPVEVKGTRHSPADHRGHGAR